MRHVRNLVFLLVFFSFIPLGFSKTKIKLAYVNMQKVITSTSAGKKARSQLEKEFKLREAELKKKEAKLNEKSKEFQKKSLVFSDAVKLEKQQELQQEMLKFRETLGRSQAELQKRERALMKPILEKISKIIEEVGEKEGYTMIFEKSGQGVLWANEKNDITDKLIRAFEKAK